MAEIVVDTDVVSYHFKNDTRARLYRRRLVGKDLTISFITVAELDHWALSRKWAMKSREHIMRFLHPYRVQYPDRALCRLWAELTHASLRAHKPLDRADAWIAATALALGVPLVTNNVAAFQHVEGLDLLTEAF